MSGTNDHCIKNTSLPLTLSPLGLHLPLACGGKIRSLLHTDHASLRHTHTHRIIVIIVVVIKACMRTYLSLLLPLQTILKVTNLEVYVLQQVEGLSVEAHIQQHLRVVHVVGELSWRREVTEGHHLFGAVDDHRLIDVGASGLGLLLQEDNIKTDSDIFFSYSTQ